MPEKITILGGGFIGLHLVERCLKEGLQVRVLDRKECPPALKGRTDWRQGDFADQVTLKNVIAGSDIVFHMISSTVPGDRVREEEELLLDVIPTLHCLNICAEFSVKRVVFISSASVYGIQERLPISESVKPEPISSHGVQKLIIEHYLHYYYYEHGLQYRIARLSNPYGYGQDINGRQGLISIVVGSIINKRPVVVRGDGTAIRDYVYIDDVIDACIALKHDQSVQHVFNIGSGQGCSVNELLSKIEQQFGSNINKVYEKSRKADLPASVLDIGLAEKHLNYHPTVDLDQGISNMLAAYGLKFSK